MHIFKKSRTLLLLSLMMAMAIPSAFAAVDEKAVTDEVLQRNDQVIDMLTAEKESGRLNADIALKIIQTEMSPIIDYQRLTQRAVGKHWKGINATVRAEIATAFQQLLENTYAKVLARYSDQKVRHVNTRKLPNDDVSVAISVIGKGKEAQIDYVFSANDAGEHRVIDIKVEKISLVHNYRRQFNSAIKKLGAEKFAKVLAAKAAAK